ncbi:MULTISPECIES: tRNA (adenosine(37)-N6)-threonylcarbamoyltransferase complex ATPase subunit type 1 TsaE [Flammeovirga]|uniref:tRNA threonylcarbamoyladenosine biosynthesis protein TsaE n=1 Tax=Flammeovirga agarivorans TaxID=2726742 RepID=A0A7X8XZ40_9BACT|nr:MULTISPECIES: tRNA (adenosine(37)-N6)-threonylcarbamoyltransferase complex ATPase subunit type 1 TsaE [Flammeovirga]NLR94816.1 tRNA (adenosine(37)-N6)-threonylcarbamoyltransferase complex ATPase subunit type 1 TsaE [Flammeovirga agarivorans]
MKANTLKITTNSLTDLPEAAKKILDFTKSSSPVWLFEGEMGAGKTTLIKAICDELGVLDHVNSPTFALVNEYMTNDADTVYHFDMYRIKDEMEAFDIGFEEYLYSQNLCLIEWPSKVERLLPDDCTEISITTIDENSREIIVTIM